MDLKKAAAELDGMVEQEDKSWLARIVKSLANPGSLLTKGAVPAEEETAEAKPEEIAKGEGDGPTPVGGGEGAEGIEETAEGELIVSGDKKKKKTSKDDAIPEGQKQDEAKVQGGDEAARAAESKKSEVVLEDVEIVDADRLFKSLEEIGESLKKSDANTDAKIAAVTAMVENLAENMATVFGALVKSQAHLIKSVEALPATAPAPGVIGVSGVRSGEIKKSAFAKRDVQVKVEQGMSDGKVPQEVGVNALSILDSRGADAAVAALGADIAKSLGLTKSE